MADNDNMAKEGEGGVASGALYAIIILIIIGVALVLLSRAKSTTPAEMPVVVKTPATSTPVAVVSGGLPSDRASKILATGLGIKPEDVTVVATEEKVWPDSCLGLAKEGEMCAQVVTPGYLVKLKVKDTLYQYRTDEKVNQIRFQK